MTIVVFGAAGGIGRRVVEQALARGWSVTAFVRRAKALDIAHVNLTIVQGDVHDADAVAAVVAGTDAVVSSLGSARNRKSKVRSEGIANIVSAMRGSRVRRVIAVSAIGVGDSLNQARISSFVFGRIILPLLLSEPFADMDRMEGILRQSGLDWTVVRPTGLTNKPAASDVRATLDGSKTGSAVPRESVAAWILDELAAPSHVGATPSVWAA